MYEQQKGRLRDAGTSYEVIRTYDELRGFARDFLHGHPKTGYRLPFLLLIGPPGIGKSMAFASAEEHGYIKGKVTAAGLYRFAYEHRDEPLVIDDADRLLKRDDATEILKSLCESREVKIVSSVTAHTGPNKALPSEFRTTSRVCMILNTIPSKMDLDDFAVMDRGAIAFFEPTPRELHRYVGTWFDRDHRDVYECFDQAWGWMLVLPQHVSARTYVKALSEKLRDRDWRQWILG